MNQEDWKEKYKQLAQDMDELQSQSNDQSVQHLLFNMAVALEGQSDVLDRSLATLKEMFKTGERGKPFASTIKLVEKEMRGLDQDQERFRKELLTALKKWILQLTEQLTTDLSRKRLKEVETESADVISHPLQLPSLLNSLLALQAPLLSPMGSKVSAVGDAVPPTAIDENDLSDADNELLLQQISAELLTLMSGLYIPKADHQDARKLIREIERGVELRTLPDIIQQLVKLIADVTSNSSADFENYLLNLTGQLAEVQTFLVESHQEEIAGGVEVSNLSRLIRHDVKEIHRAVNETMDLQELKKEVSTQLVSIVKSVDDYKRHEESREKALAERYEQMNSRLELMEKGTREVKVHMEEERLKALTDPLTSLPNRAGYDEQIAAEFARWKRYQHFFSVIVADLDLFKRINDSFGHLAGDKVLRLISGVLTRRCRTTDFVARYGGEEFVIIMPATAAAEAKQAVDNIRMAIENSPFNFHGKPVQVTMSFGVAEVREGETAEELFERADKALYKAKREGRNRVELG